MPNEDLKLSHSVVNPAGWLMLLNWHEPVVVELIIVDAIAQDACLGEDMVAIYIGLIAVERHIKKGGLIEGMYYLHGVEHGYEVILILSPEAVCTVNEWGSKQRDLWWY
jgi:hypothetical protein